MNENDLKCLVDVPISEKASFQKMIKEYRAKYIKKPKEMVDTVFLKHANLPDIESFSQRRDKTIIGTMKTTLRERWAEVIEEIARVS
jgi:hypothetical protein